MDRYRKGDNIRKESWEVIIELGLKRIIPAIIEERESVPGVLSRSEEIALANAVRQLKIYGGVTNSVWFSREVCDGVSQWFKFFIDSAKIKEILSVTEGIPLLRKLLEFHGKYERLLMLVNEKFNCGSPHMWEGFLMQVMRKGMSFLKEHVFNDTLSRVVHVSCDAIRNAGVCENDFECDYAGHIEVLGEIWKVIVKLTATVHSACGDGIRAFWDSVYMRGTYPPWEVPLQLAIQEMCTNYLRMKACNLQCKDLAELSLSLARREMKRAEIFMSCDSACELRRLVMEGFSEIHADTLRRNIGPLIVSKNFNHLQYLHLVYSNSANGTSEFSKIFFDFVRRKICKDVFESRGQEPQEDDQNEQHIFDGSKYSVFSYRPTGSQVDCFERLYHVSECHKTIIEAQAKIFGLDQWTAGVTNKLFRRICIDDDWLLKNLLSLFCMQMRRIVNVRVGPSSLCDNLIENGPYALLQYLNTQERLKFAFLCNEQMSNFLELEVELMSGNALRDVNKWLKALPEGLPRLRSNPLRALQSEIKLHARTLNQSFTKRTVTSQSLFMNEKHGAAVETVKILDSERCLGFPHDLVKLPRLIARKEEIIKRKYNLSAKSMKKQPDPESWRKWGCSLHMDHCRTRVVLNSSLKGCAGKPIRLNLFASQASILLVLCRHRSLPYKTLVKRVLKKSCSLRSGINAERVIRGALLSLTEPHPLIVRNIGRGEFKAEDVFSVSKVFAPNRTELTFSNLIPHLNHNDRPAVPLKNRNEEKGNEHQLPNVKQACLMPKRIISASISKALKEKRVMDHQKLRNAVTRKCAHLFEMSDKDFKECIENLIDLDYIKRCTNDRQSYEYMP